MLEDILTMYCSAFLEIMEVENNFRLFMIGAIKIFLFFDFCSKVVKGKFNKGGTMSENSEEKTSQEENVLVEECSGNDEEMKKQEGKQQHPNMSIGYAGYRHPREADCS